MTKTLLVLVGVLGIGALSLLIDVQSRAGAVHSPPPTGQCAIAAPGRIEGATEEIELHLQLTGRVSAVLVQEGQQVRRGEVLVELDDQEYAHEEALAEADLSLAKAKLERLENGARAEERAEAAALYRAKVAELEQARKLCARLEKLVASRATSEQEADEQRSLVKSLSAETEAAKARQELLDAPARPDEIRIHKAGVEAAQARLELARVQRERCRLRAPIDGQVLEIDVEPGELTGPTATQPAVILTDSSRYRVRAFVEELEAPRVRTGMRVTAVADGLAGQNFYGRVSQLSPRMSRKSMWTDDPGERYDTKTREIWIDLEPAGDLVVGLRVDVMIDPVAEDHPAETETLSLSSAEPASSSEPAALPPETSPLATVP